MVNRATKFKRAARVNIRARIYLYKFINKFIVYFLNFSTLIFNQILQ